MCGVGKWKEEQEGGAAAAELRLGFRWSDSSLEEEGWWCCRTEGGRAVLGGRFFGQTLFLLLSSSKIVVNPFPLISIELECYFERTMRVKLSY